MACNIIYKNKEYTQEEFLRFMQNNPGEFTSKLADDIDIDDIYGDFDIFGDYDFNESLEAAMDPRFEKLLDNRKRILKKLTQLRSNARDRGKIDILQDRIEAIKAQMDTLKDDNSRTLGTILQFMQSDIDTVTKLLDSSPDLASLEYGNQLIYNYVNLLYTDFKDNIEGMDDASKADVLKMITTATNLAERIRQQLLNKAAAKVNQFTGDKVMIDGVVVDSSDINDVGKFLKDTTENPNSIVQTLTKIIKTAISKLSLKYTGFKATHTRLVKALVDFQKKAGLKKNDYYEFMVERDETGTRTGNFIGQYSRDYYISKDLALEDPMQALKFFAENHTFKVNPKAWDVREANLKQWFKDNRADQVTLTDKELADGKTYEEKLEERAYAFAIRRNPYTVLSILEKARDNGIASVTGGQLKFFADYMKSGFYFEIVDGERQYTLDFIPSSQWEEPKWKAIQAMSDSDPRKVFYNHFTKHMADGRAMVSNEEHYLPWNYIPEKTKSLGVAGNLRQWAVDNISQTISTRDKGIDPFTGEIEKKIPVYMLGNTISPENKSYDLADVLENFMKEAINYDEKAAIEDDAKLLLLLLREQKTYLTNPDGTPKVNEAGEVQYKEVSNNFKMAEYRLNAQLYGDSQDKEMVTKIKQRDVLVQKQLKELKDKANALNLTEDEKAEALKYIEVGAPYPGGNSKIGDYIRIANRYKELSNQVKYITGNKVANTMIYATSIKLLGFNLFGGFAEVLQGAGSLMIEAAARTNFTDSEALWALGKMIKTVGPFESKEKRKIDNLSKAFDAQGKVFHDAEQNNIVSKGAFAIYAGANYLMNNSFLLASLRHRKVTDKEGNEHSLYDVLEVDDNMRFSWNKPGITQELYTNGEYSQYLIDLMHQFKEVLKNNRERQTFEDPIILEKNVIGRIVGQFKKNWMFRAYYTRFGGERDADLFTNMKSKGFYRSFLEQVKFAKKKDEFGNESVDILGSVIKVPLRLMKLWFRFSLFGRLTGQGVKPGEFDEVDEANLRKFMRESSMIISIMLVVLCLTAGSGDDKDPYRTYVANQLIRLQRDMTTYMSPESFASIFRNPAPVVSTFTDLFAINQALIKSTVLGDPYLYEGTSRERSRVGVAVSKSIPLVNQIDRTFSKFQKVINYDNY